MTSLDQEHSKLADATQAQAAVTGETLIIVFNEQGEIIECSANAKTIVGYSREELLSRHISTLVSYLQQVPLFVRGEFNPQVGFLSHCGMPFRIKHRDGSSFDGAVSVVQLHHLSPPAIRMLIMPPAHKHVPASRAAR